MKITAIMGSPRKGNTLDAVRKIEAEILAVDPTVEVNYVFLKDTKLEPCRGCFACIGRGEELCPHKDALSDVLNTMLDADGVIIASPSYVQSVPALMKNFIDRAAYLCHRPVFFDKPCLVVVTSCGGGIKETLTYLSKIMRSWGFASTLNLGIMMHPAMGYSPKTLANIKRTAQQFLATVRQGDKTVPGLLDLMQFRMMRFNAQMDQKHFPADVLFYADKNDYYLPRRAGAIKSGAARIFEKLIVRIMDATM